MDFAGHKHVLSATPRMMEKQMNDFGRYHRVYVDTTVGVTFLEVGG